MLDLCLGSPEFVLALTKVAVLPFGIPVHLPGDHWAVILDFDSHILFGPYQVHISLIKEEFIAMLYLPSPNSVNLLERGVTSTTSKNTFLQLKRNTPLLPRIMPPWTKLIAT